MARYDDLGAWVCGTCLCTNISTTMQNNLLY